MAASRPSYRTTLLLCGFVVLGWIWDLALGGGLGHSLAWLGALILIGGISALAVRGGRVAADETPFHNPSSGAAQGFGSFSVPP
ncbi:MAG: hypothetical protein ACR2N4_01565, partial [Jatrophihabitans sp.]